MKDKLYDFDLPDELIASYPPAQRTESKLLIYSLANKVSQIEKFEDISRFLRPGDNLVRNITKVEKRRIYAVKEDGKEFEIMLLKPEDYFKKKWQCLVKGLKKWSVGDSLVIQGSNNVNISLISRENQFALIHASEPLTARFLNKFGHMPIPPYLKRKAIKIDEDRYQTTFAEIYGSSAAPTAGLHFSNQLTGRLKEIGINFIDIVLHIGYGTFASLNEENYKYKKLHQESYVLSDDAAQQLNRAKLNKERIFAVGTTSLRTLESNYRKNNGSFKAEKSETEIFLHPPDTIGSVNGLITNFHLPKSSLMMLVSCFTGREKLLEIYKLAVKEKMRFFSYGDAMLLLP
jgi:S-adenosylmethionine:tRNA ribosyltransferase-isomerase